MWSVSTLISFPLQPPRELGSAEMPIGIWGSGKWRLNWGCIYFRFRGIYLCGLQSRLRVVSFNHSGEGMTSRKTSAAHGAQH